MTKIETEKIRNVIFLAHSGAGKTSLVEAILYNTGATGRMGTVQEGNTICDFEQEEIERSFSITSSVAYCDWKGHRINLIDTPGFINFVEDTKGCIKAADGAVVLVSAQDGVKPETKKLWKYATGFNIPKMVFVNKIDKEHASFDNALKGIKTSFGIDPVPVNIPIGVGSDFSGIVDILNLKAYKVQAKKSDPIDIPEDMQAQVDEYRKKLIEAVAETDDALLEKYFDGGDLTADEIAKGLRIGTFAGNFLPVTCGAASGCLAVSELIDTIIHCMPSPLDIADINPITGKNPKDDSEVERKVSKDEPCTAFVFKTISDPFSGKLSLFRVLSGTVKSDSTIYNSTKGSKERMGHIAYLIGKKQVPVDELGPGEIGVVAKLKETQTGDTLCDQAKPIVLPPVKFAEPIISYAIAPKSKGDEDKVSVGLHKILDEDVSLKFHMDEESHDMIIAGMGQLHVEIALQKLKRKFGVEVEMHAPKVPYRETIKGTAKSQGKYKKQSGGKGQYGDCWIEVKPVPHGEGFSFIDNVVGGSIPRQYIPAVEKGIIERLKQGILAGYPMIDVEVRLYDGSFHAVDSSEMAFKIAGSFAIKEAAMNAKPVLLEPIMSVHITVPDDMTGAVVGDLNSRRGKVQGMEPQGGGVQLIDTLVPMGEMLTYANQLQSLTSGQGMYTMEFFAYEEVPAHVAQTIIKEKEDEKVAV